MSRRGKSSPSGADPAGWFFRLERAVREGDYLVANEARKQLSRLGWAVRHNTQQTKPEPDRPKAVAR
jgi:hypothetical protein